MLIGHSFEFTGEIDFTMLRQICRRGRLMACLRSSSLYPESPSTPFSSIIAKAASTILRTPAPKIDTNGAGLKIVDQDAYEAILHYLNAAEQFTGLSPLRHAQDLPHPYNARILPRSAFPIRQFKHKGRDYSTFETHPGNSSVFFNARVQSGADSGHIESVWRFTIDGKQSRTFVVLSVHQPLSSGDAKRNPYQERPGFLANVVYARSSNVSALRLMIFEPQDIVGHVAYYVRPPGTFGIKKSTNVIINSLHRYRV